MHDFVQIDLRLCLNAFRIMCWCNVKLFTLLEFFTSALADGFSLMFEWQQVSKSLLDSSQYSSRSQQYCSLDGLHPSSNFQVLQSLYNPLVTVPKAPITFGIIVTCMFQSQSQSPIGVCVYHSPGQMLGCAYTICSYNQISISCRSPSGSPCPPSRV